jgi:DNA-binding beta-propeller fold protein YncE
MKCVFCAYELTNDGRWNFCPECGASVSGKCYKCGEDILPGAKFCVVCGASMRRRQFALKLSDEIALMVETEAGGPAAAGKTAVKKTSGEGRRPEKAAAEKLEDSPSSNGADGSSSLDLNSFNQSETPDFLKNINAKHVEKYKNESVPAEAGPSDRGFLDSRSFNQSETPDFLSEIIKKGKPPLFDIKYDDAAGDKDKKESAAPAAVKPDEKTPKAPSDTKPAEDKTPKVPAENKPAEDKNPKAPSENKPAAEKIAVPAGVSTEPVPGGEAPKPHSFDKFKTVPRIDSILKEGDHQFQPNWGVNAPKKTSAGEADKTVAEETGKTNVEAPEKDALKLKDAAEPAPKKHIEVKAAREDAPGRDEPVKLSVRKLIAVDSGNNRIQFVTSAAKFMSSFGTRGSGHLQFDNPQKAVVDAPGNIYVSDFSNNRIQKFTPEGHFMLAFGSHGGKNGEFNYPCGLAISKEGLLFVVDSYNNRVQIFDCDGKYISKFEGAEMASDIQLDTPSDIAVDSANNIYVCDTGNNRVIKFDPKWRKLYELGIADKKMQGFDSPSAITVDAEDNLIVADTGNHLIKIFDSMGGLTMSFGSKGQKEGKLDSPGAVDCDGENNIYVADTWNNRIQIFSYEGKFIKSIGSYGSDPGKFNHINDVVVLSEII